jgi:uncharacterized protein (TIGR02145 family)
MKKRKKFRFSLLLITGAAIVVLNSCGQSTSNTTDPGVVINGVKWATRNVASPGVFANKPEDAGMFYQWNRKVAWPAVGEVSDWDDSEPDGDTWEKANDPSPEGWRVPTPDEIGKLLDEDKVSRECIKLNGVNVCEFTDKATGNSMILPAAGVRDCETGMLDYVGANGGYWGSTSNDTGACFLLFDIEEVNIVYGNHGYGICVRCVSEE